MHIVYLIQGTHTHHCYIGYCAGQEETTKAEILEAFLIGAHRPDPDRGDVRLFTENKKDQTVLTVDLLDVFDDEMDAWICRNELRSLNHMSITGPTMLPGGIAAKEKPESVAAWTLRLKQRGAKTARQAWALGLWTNEKIKSLSLSYHKNDVIMDLDKLNPDQFAIKYNLGVVNV